MYQMLRDKTEKGYHKLILWNRMKEFIILTYKLTNKLPKDEEFSLKNQMRRAGVSVLSNFVEGYLKRSLKDKLRFIEIAKASLMELEAQSEICLILKYWDDDDYNQFDQKRGEVGYLMFRYSQKVV
jgi:four helix bundle protein